MLFFLRALLPLVAFAGGARVRAVVPGDERIVPKFVVNLDIPPEERWKDVITYLLDVVGWGEVAKNMKRQGLNQMPEKAKPRWIAALKNAYSEEILREMDGWVKYAGRRAGLTKDDLILWQAQYEENFPNYCAGVLAAMPNGTVVHGRNMDYVFHVYANGKWNFWGDLTMDVTFLRGGVPLYNSIVWPGQLGVTTAMRFGGWTFEQNTRRTARDIDENLIALENGGKPHATAARWIVENVPDFEIAVQAFQSTQFASQNYFIISGAGPWQGTILSSDRLAKPLPDSPPPQRLSPQHWLLLQTNSDTNKEDTDFRRPIAQEILSHASQLQVSSNWMLDVMTNLPLRVPKTLYTYVAIPATGYHNVVLTPKWVEEAAVTPEEEKKVEVTIEKAFEHAAKSIGQAIENVVGSAA